MGGEDIVLNHYDFTGKIIESWVCHKTNLESPGKRIIRQKNDYDHADRLLTTKQQMTGATNLVTIASNSYNELGQLQKKEVGGVQEMNCSYNIRGWLTQINNPDDPITSGSNKKFAMRLNYNNPVTYLINEAQYNGNISSIEWRSVSGGDVSDSKRGYGFSYDFHNRLENAYYGEGDQLVRNPGYDETITGYDFNGNIMGLNRNKVISNGPVNIDNLTYSYKGNQLTSVTDNASASHKAEGFYDVSNTVDYDYDLNGNLSLDRNKGISQIQYNHLNLPKKIVDQNNSMKTIEYIYNANGQKLARKSPENLTTYYSGIFVYEETLEGDAVVPRLKYILHPEGMVDMASTQYQYFLKDHLGNTRVVVNSDNATLQITNYYPFGLTSQSFQSGIDNKYLYNGKELQEDEIGNGMLDWYDYGARMYDLLLGRFHTQDPLSEMYYSLSSYAYVANNPLKYIDPTGMWIQYSDSTGSYRYNDGQWEQYQTQGQHAGRYTAYTAESGSFLEGVLDGLNRLNKNVTGNELLSFFANDDNNATIFSGVENSADISGSATGSVYLSSTFEGSAIPTENGIQTSPFWLDIGHELSHRKDVIVNGASQAGALWLTNPDTGKPIPRSEIYATHMENLMRADESLPLRSHYVRQGAGGWEDSRILISGTRVNKFNGTTYRSTPRLLTPIIRVPSLR